MICPAILDPFQGGNYRLYACMHQAFLCPIISKVFAYIFTPVTPINELTEGDSASKQCSYFPGNANSTASRENVQYKQNVTVDNGAIVGSMGKNSIENGCDNGSTSLGTNKKLD